MSKRIHSFPFSAIIGQEDMKLGLLLNVADPKLGGLLAFGEKGTAKSTAVRAIAGLLPQIKVVKDCRFRCDPEESGTMCQECRSRFDRGESLDWEYSPMKVVDLPVSATEDRVVGTLDLEEAIRHGKKKFDPGILADANRGILYVDEVNLLDDHIVDLLLDSAAMGVNTVEREGVSYSHPARFVLVGTMNPEEGELRPQLLDRFGLSVRIVGITDPAKRVQIIKYRTAYDQGPEAFCKKFAGEDKKVTDTLTKARENLTAVSVSDELLLKIAEISVALGIDGHRGDLTLMKAIRGYAALEGRQEAQESDIKVVAHMVFLHRMRSLPFEQAKSFDPTVIEKILHKEAQG